MKQVACVLFVATLAVVIVSGCQPPRSGWVDKPPVFDDAYAVVGVSSRGLSEAMARTQAETRGRTRIAFVLETRVAAMTKDFLTASSSFRNEDAIISEDQFTQEVSRSVTKQTIKGAFVKEYHVAKDGTVYALVVLKKGGVLKNAKGQIWERALENALYNEYQTEQALKELDAAVEKEYKAALQAQEARK